MFNKFAKLRNNIFRQALQTSKLFLFDSFQSFASWLWSSCSLTDNVDSLEVTDLISDVADNCLDREHAHNAYNSTPIAVNLN